MLIVEGIGIASLKSMAYALRKEGRRFKLHFSAKSPREAPYQVELRREFKAGPKTYWLELGVAARVDIESLFTNSREEAVIYVCGPQRMLDAVREVADRLQLRDDRIRFDAPLEKADDRPFMVKTRRTGVVL